MRRALILLGLPLAVVLTVAATTKDDYFEMSKQLEIMQSAFRELNLFYVDPLAPGELMETGIKAMLAQLDPYTRYFPETKMEDVRFMQTGEYGGIGASIETRNGRTTIVDLLEGEPAELGGIQLGDVLQRIDGRDIANLEQGTNRRPSSRCHRHQRRGGGRATWNRRGFDLRTATPESQGARRSLYRHVE